MTDTAIILAAGLGSRLKDRTKLMPKGFLDIEGTAMIKRSVDKLIAAGIKKIYLGTGYIGEEYESFAKAYDNVFCVKNPVYASSGSMCTLSCFKDIVKSDFLLLESDLLYDKAGLRYLLDCDKPTAILASGETKSNDEVYIETDNKGFLVNMSKRADALSRIDGELVGISKIGHSFFAEMCKAFEKSDTLKMEYEAAIVQAGKLLPAYILKKEDYAWCEIDDENHLNRALQKIYPKIKEAEERNK